MLRAPPPSAKAKAPSQDEAAIRKVAAQLYTHVFKTPEAYPKMEPVKPIFVAKLYALILPESKRKVETEEDVSAYQFIPGNGGADKWALKPPVIKGASATVAVIFDGRDGRDGESPHKMVLTLEKQNSGQWLIADLAEWYDGELLSWMKRLAVAPASPGNGPSTVMPDREQWLGRNADEVAAKAGLERHSVKDISPDGLYSLVLFKASGKATAAVLGKRIGKPEDENPQYTVLDMLALPRIEKLQFVSEFASFKGTNDDELFGIGLGDDTDSNFKKCVKAWRANLKTKKFEEVPPADITVSFPNEEGYEPE